MVRAPSCLFKFKEICVEPCNRSLHILEPSLSLSCICFSGENTTPSTATEDHGEWRWSCSPEQSATVGYRNQQQLWSGSRKHYWTRYICFGLQGRSKDYILLTWYILIDMQLLYFLTVTRVWLIYVDTTWNPEPEWTGGIYFEQVRWPVSLVLSRRALTKYQLIFRHLFHCKHVKRQLCAAWQIHQVYFVFRTSFVLQKLKFQYLLVLYLL